MIAPFRPSLLTTVRPLELRKRLLSPLVRRVWKKNTQATHDGIALVDVSFRQDLQNEFVGQTIRALELARQKDPRHYQRIRGSFDFIVHEELVVVKAQYWRWPAACVLDFSRYPFQKSPEAVLFMLTTTLVHEATHAVLFRRGVPHTRKNFLEVERLCCLEEARFAKRINPRLGSGWLEKRFNAAQLERAYNELPRLSLSMLWRRRVESKRTSDEALRKTAAPRRS